jgi:hypothetical protein
MWFRSNFMTNYRLLCTVLVAATIALGACTLRGSGGLVVRPSAVVVVEEEPPPPRVETYELRPGFLWVNGRWYRDGARWDWRAGHEERVRVGYAWQPGQWERRGRGHVWIDGRWTASGNHRARNYRR